MKKVLLKLVIMTFVGQSAMQTYDWPSLFGEARSTDPSVRAKYADYLEHKIVPDLINRTPEQLAPVLLSLERTANANESFRLDVSGLLATILVTHRGSSVALEPSIPFVIGLFKDKNNRVRRNAVGFMASINPAVPEIAVEPFINALDDEDAPTVTAATTGLARLCRNSMAIEALGGSLDSGKPKQRRLVTLEALGKYKCQNSAVLNTLGRMLLERDREIVFATIRSIGQLGTEARSLKNNLDFLANGKVDPEIAKAASTVSALLSER